jgi:hypothetical protein
VPRLVILLATATAIVHGADELVLRPDFAEPTIWRVAVRSDSLAESSAWCTKPAQT